MQTRVPELTNQNISDVVHPGWCLVQNNTQHAVLYTVRLKLDNAE